jgi:phosphoglycolate phosphatase
MSTTGARLILWDVDGTLLQSGGAGRSAMAAAGCELYGEHFTLDGVEMGGQLDSSIWIELARANRIPGGPTHEPLFRSTYAGHLARRFEVGPPAQLLPGIAELVARLGTRPEVTQGILSGNYPETGRMKVASAGLDPEQFRVCAWGPDAPTREQLVPVALERHAAYTGAAIDPKHVTIVGDTLRDIACARANGCRVLAVATGMVPAAALAANQPDLLLDDLASVDEVLAFLLG